MPSHTDILGQYKIDSIVEKENGASANMYSVTSVMHGLVVGDSILLTGIYPKSSFFNENVFFVKTIVDSNTFDIVAGQDSSKYTYSEGGAFIRLDDATRRGPTSLSVITFTSPPTVSVRNHSFEPGDFLMLVNAPGVVNTNRINGLPFLVDSSISAIVYPLHF